MLHYVFKTSSADVHLYLQNGRRALLDLARSGYARNVELLENGSKEALLRTASEGGDTKTVKKLLEEGVNVNSCDLVSNIDGVNNCYTT